MELKIFLDNLKVNQYKDVQNAIIKECFINRSTFHHWRTGKNNPPILAQIKINEISKRLTNKIVFNNI